MSLREQHVHNGERRHQTHARLPQERRGGARSSAPRSAVEPCLHLVIFDDLVRKTLQNLSWEKTVKTLTTIWPPPSAPRPLLPKNPLWGSWAPPCTNVMLTAVSSVRALVSTGARVAPPKEATHDGQSPPGNNSRGSVTHHRTCLAALADTWLTPSFTSQVSLKGQDLTGY